jgi:uncharacterized protein (TIGR02588 family)
MPHDRRNESRWERVAAAVSAALVLFVLGLLSYDAVARPQTPPSVEVRADTVLQSGGMWLVEFEAFNRGHNTAAAVKVEGRIRGAAGEEETSEAVLDYVPGRSRRRGGLFFRQDPRGRGLELRAHGYQEP